MRNQAATPHALALKPYTGERFEGRKLRERGGAEYEYTRTGVRITRDGHTETLPIRWAFGSGVQAITPLIERNGKWIEHRVSWYREGNRLGLTPGHTIPAGLEFDDAIGVVQTARNTGRCFACHNTNGEPGVTCQTCHGGGDAHRNKPVKGSIPRERSIELCAQCHRSPDTVFASATPELEDPRSIRFAPIGLKASKCFQKGATTCVSCHNPHGEPARAVTEVCAACHQAKAKKSCPRTADCLSCHMKQSSPVVGLRFTDHRIRIYDE